jgi:hypothetical protein
MYARYKTLIRCGYVLLSVYFVLAVLSPLHLIEDQEVFPFFSWSLFSSPKWEVTFYTLVLEKESIPSETSPPFGTGDGYVRLVDSPLGQNVFLNKVLATFSRDAKDNTGDEAELFETTYRDDVEALVRGHASRYHLFRTVYNPIELFRERRYRESRYIASYELDEKER